MQFRVNSIFESISGEAGFFSQGSWCTFIRLQGCNLRCAYCDTPESLSSIGGTLYDVEKLVQQCNTRQVLITGGEPFYQGEESLSELITLLRDVGHVVQIETNGSYAMTSTKHRPGAYWIVDYKCPSSGTHTKMPHPSDFVKAWRKELAMIKLVVDPGSLDDLSFAVESMIAMRVHGSKAKYIMSPLNAQADSIKVIADYVHREAPELLDSIIFSVQIHKMANMP